MSKNVVAHSVSPYLFFTGSWIYSQIVNLKRFHPIVLTTELLNLDIFPFREVYSIGNLPKYRAFLEKAYAKIFATYYFSWLKTCKTKDVKIIHSHFGFAGWRNLHLAEKLGIPHVVSFYGADMSRTPLTQPKWLRRYKRLFRNVNLVIVEGPFARARIIQLGCDPEKAVINRLGINLENIHFKERKLTKDETIKVLAIGTFTEKKGIPYAIESFKLCLKQYPNMKLTLIGDANNLREQREEKQKIIEIISKSNIDKKIDMLGFVPYNKLLELSYDHHIFLAPSITAKDGDTEGGSPVVISEMAAAGMPVVSTRHADIPEVIVDGQNGFLVEERNSYALCDALGKTIEQSKQWPEMGRFSRKYIDQKFDSKKQAGRLEEIYLQTLNG